jgi:DNA-binding NtrC family response regulator
MKAMQESNQLISLEEVDRRHILKVIEHCHGNRTNAAQLLEIDRKTLYRKLLRWGVDK